MPDNGVYIRDTANKTYLFSFAAVLPASAYPLYTGAAMLLAYIKNGGADAADYPGYVIPHTQ